MPPASDGGGRRALFGGWPLHKLHARRWQRTEKAARRLTEEGHAVVVKLKLTRSRLRIHYEILGCGDRIGIGVTSTSTYVSIRCPLGPRPPTHGSPHNHSNA
eukprot:scaffold136818_cov30-Tisochrysis_lutea.AAC.1